MEVLLIKRGKITYGWPLICRKFNLSTTLCASSADKKSTMAYLF